MDFRQLRWSREQALAEDYVERFARVDELFVYDPQDDGAWAARAEKLAGKGAPAAARAAVAEALEAYNREAGNAPEAMEMIRLIGEGAPVVVGGQQAGLFTGQLMVVYKAMTIVKAAERAAQRLGRPVVPVFWIAGEDHDIAEVNHIYIPVKEAEPARIRLPAADGSAGRIPVSRLRIAWDQWEHVLDELERCLQPTEFKQGLVGEMRELCSGADTLSELFAKMMARLFGRYGLVLADSDDPRLRALEAPFFRAIIDKNGTLAAALAEGKRRVEALGYTPSAEVRDACANLFWVRENERHLLFREQGGFSDRTGSLKVTEAELVRMAESEPGALGNNVFTRPLMQEYLFPVLAAVLGPGEISYWALLRRAFEIFGMEMPIIVPRLEFTVVEGTVQKLLDKFGLSVEDALLRLEEKRTEWFKAQDELGIERLFADVRRRFDELYAPVIETAGKINPGLRRLGETNRQKILEQITFMESHTREAFESGFEAASRQFDRIRVTLTPLGKRQERVFNPLAYMNKYGRGWIDELMRLKPNWNGLHNVILM